MWQVLMSAMLSSQTKDPVTAAGVNRMREVRRTEEREQAARSRPAGLLFARSFGPFGGGGREGRFATYLSTPCFVLLLRRVVAVVGHPCGRLLGLLRTQRTLLSQTPE